MKAFLKMGLLLNFLLLTLMVGAQSIKISGQVLSKEDNTAIAGVAVVASGQSQGACVGLGDACGDAIGDRAR